MLRQRSRTSEFLLRLPIELLPFFFYSFIGHRDAESDTALVQISDPREEGIDRWTLPRTTAYMCTSSSSQPVRSNLSPSVSCYRLLLRLPILQRPPSFQLSSPVSHIALLLLTSAESASTFAIWRPISARCSRRPMSAPRLLGTVGSVRRASSWIRTRAKAGAFRCGQTGWR